MYTKIFIALVGLASLLTTQSLLSQANATITIKKNMNGTVTEETQRIELDNGQNIQDILSKMGVLDEFGNLKEGQQFEIKIDKYDHQDNQSLNFSVTPDINSFPGTFSQPVKEKRPFLGVILKEKEITDKGANIKTLEVREVEPGSAAQKAGILSGDIIAQIDGKDVSTSSEFVKEIQSRKIGDEIKITVNRGGKKKKLKATLGEKVMEVQRPIGQNGMIIPDNQGELPFFNFRFGPDSITILSPRSDSVKICQPFAWNNGQMVVKETAYLGVTPSADGSSTTTKGVKVNVEKETSAEKMGLISGDVITKYNDVDINNFSELADAVSKTKAGDDIRLTILRDGKQREIAGAVGKRSCSHFDDFRIFHDYKGMDEGGNYFYDYEFDMDIKDLEKHMDELLRGLDNEQLRIDRERERLEEELGRIRSNESIHINIRIDEITTEEQQSINKNANPKLETTNSLSFDQISFYPNPSNGLLNLNFTTSETSPVKIVLYNASGNTVYLEERSLTDGKYINTIDIADQPNGSYYLQIIQGNKSYSKKVIKNN